MARQQHLLFTGEDIFQRRNRESGAKHLFTDTDSTEISSFQKSMSGFSQLIEVKWRIISFSTRSILAKNNIQTPVKLIFNAPMLPHRLCKLLNFYQCCNEKSCFNADFALFMHRGFDSSDGIQVCPICLL